MFTRSIRAGLALLGATAAIASGAATANGCPMFPAPAAPPAAAAPTADPPCFSHYNPSSDTFEWTCGLGA